MNLKSIMSSVLKDKPRYTKILKSLCEQTLTSVGQAHPEVVRRASLTVGRGAAFAEETRKLSKQMS